MSEDEEAVALNHWYNKKDLAERGGMKMMNQFKAKAPRQDWQTPEWLQKYALPPADWGKVYDITAQNESQKIKLAAEFLPLDDFKDKFKEEPKAIYFANPPWDNPEPWIRSFSWAIDWYLRQEYPLEDLNRRLILILPAATDRAWFDLLLSLGGELNFSKGRASYIHPETKAEMRGCPIGTLVWSFVANWRHISTFSVRNLKKGAK